MPEGWLGHFLPQSAFFASKIKGIHAEALGIRNLLLTGPSTSITIESTHSPHVLPNGEGPTKVGVQKASFSILERHLAIFSKKAETPAALLAKLIAQNLEVPNKALALQYLTYVGHYRLKGYWFHLIDPATNKFKSGTTFDIIKARYEFDREIRALILEAVERLEVAIRSTICNFLSLKYTPHWYLDGSLFKPVRKFGMGQMLSKIEQEVGRSHEKTFIEAYYADYDEPYLPPSWAMSECVTLGMWSRTYQILRDTNDKKSISAKFGIPQVEVFESWVHTLTVLRNMSAHHDRFLHNKLRVSPTNHTAKKIKFTDNRSVYAALTVIHVLLDAIGFNTTFRQRIINLEATHGTSMLQELGFPKNWPAGAIGW